MADQGHADLDKVTLGISARIALNFRWLDAKLCYTFSGQRDRVQTFINGPNSQCCWLFFSRPLNLGVLNLRCGLSLGLNLFFGLLFGFLARLLLGLFLSLLFGFMFGDASFYQSLNRVSALNNQLLLVGKKEFVPFAQLNDGAQVFLD